MVLVWEEGCALDQRLRIDHSTKSVKGEEAILAEFEAGSELSLILRTSIAFCAPPLDD